MSERRPSGPPHWKYDVVGFLGGDFGLAVAARNSVRALAATGRLGEEVAVEVEAPERPVDRALRLLRRKPRAPASPRRVDAGARRVSLFQMNPLEIAWYAPQWRAAAGPAARNAIVPFWELPLVPRNWAPMLGAMDAVLAPTRFVQSACAAAAPGTPVLHYPQAVFLPDGVRPAREAWGVAGRRTVFVVSFDLGSDVDRKNPWAALDAFRRAFPGGEDVALVVKSKPWPQVPEYVAQAEALRARIGSDPRVRIVDRSLPYEEVLALYASCDVMLSLHRSEGLGLHLMEAMSLGRVVVGTGWSGNADFMTPGNSVPVGHRLVPVRTRHSHYQSEVGRAGQVWAEADVAAAAEALRALHADPQRREALGAAAARDMEARRAAMLGGGAFEALEEALPEAGARQPGLRWAVRRTRVHSLARELRGAARAFARRLGRGS
jgi:glycosyltransferase involved in cell wall biosynthesis